MLMDASISNAVWPKTSKDFIAECKESSVCIDIYNGDTCLETFSLGIPYHLYWNEKYGEIRAAELQFLCSDVSSYINGKNIIMDSGRLVW